MNPNQVIVQGMVRADGTLEVNQPVALPPGHVQVIVQAAAIPSTVKDDPCLVVQRIGAQRRALGMQGRTKEQIDADIRSMRNEWEQ